MGRGSLTNRQLRKLAALRAAEAPGKHEIPDGTFEGVDSRIAHALGFFVFRAKAAGISDHSGVRDLGTRVLMDTGLRAMFANLVLRLPRSREITSVETIESVVSGDVTAAIEAAGVRWSDALEIVQVVCALIGAGTEPSGGEEV